MSRAEPEQVVWQIDLSDEPGHQLIASQCLYPDSIDGGYDLALPVTCPEHGRTIWWCLNVALLWCDGGPPDYDYHPYGVRYQK